MRKISKKQIALVHVARHRLGLEEDTYRDILSQFNVQSSKELSYAQFKELMDIFERMGFKRRRKKKRSKSIDFHPVKTERTGQKAKGSPFLPITDKQMKKLWALWNSVSRAPVDSREAALNKFVKRITGVDHWRWLNVGKAQKVIIALEKMAETAGN